jgi:lycopene cyclase domain-containing protein
MQSLYLWVDILVILLPLLGSFESRVCYYRRWGPLFGSILLVMVPFILWDILFTASGAWHFNSQYSGKVTLMGLPLAEWLFFICIPYACLYIYEWVRYVRDEQLRPLRKGSALYWFHAVLAASCLIIAFVLYEKSYTSVVFGLAGVLLFVINIVRPVYMSRFWIAYLFTLIPFFIVNGYLTAKPIVLYNDQENLGVRLYTIPVEDLFYTFLMLMPIIMIYEQWLKRDTSDD